MSIRFTFIRSSSRWFGAHEIGSAHAESSGEYLLISVANGPKFLYSSLSRGVGALWTMMLSAGLYDIGQARVI